MSRKLTKRVLCNQTGITYDSVREASKELNVAPSGISQVANGNLKSTKGLTFSYVDEDNSEDELLVLRRENEELRAKLEKSETLTPTLEELKLEFKEQIDINSEIKNALNIINKYFNRANDVQPFYNRQSEIDKLRNDYLHLVENIELKSPSEVNSTMNSLRKVMIERRVVKEAINCYKSLSKIEGLSKIDWIELNAKNYTPRVLDIGKFKSGDEIDVKKLDTTISSDEYKAFIEELHSVPVTSKYSAKQIGFVKNNLKDLCQKIEQMRNCNAKYSKFRVVDNLLHCYN